MLGKCGFGAVSRLNGRIYILDYMSTKREIDEDVFHVEREVGADRVM